MRTGIGYDSHRLVKGRKLFLGGVEIPDEKGLLGHSDGDALLHAITDAVLGALGAGDIGRHFPDTGPEWKDARSIHFLKHAVELATSQGFTISWIDTTVIAEAPKLAPHIDAMKEAISASGIPTDRINIKATTNEGMGLIGAGEGIAAFAVCTLKKMV